MGKTISHEDYLIRFNDRVGVEYVLLSRYINSKTKISILHKECNRTYETSPHVPLSGHGCPYCAKERIAQNQRMSQQDFEDKIYNLTNGEYKVVSEYTTAKNKVKFLHTKCDNVLETTADNFISQGVRCKHCREVKQRKTHEKFIQEVYNLVGNEYTFLGTYEKAKLKIPVIHNVCKHKYEVTPNNFLRGYRCPICMIEESAKKLRRTHEMFVDEVFDLVGNEYEILGQYKNARTKIEMKHYNCDFIFEVIPDHFINSDSRCPKCADISLGEKSIKELLDLHKINYIRQYRFNDCRNINPLPFDFAIFDFNGNLQYIIEYDGQQHFHPVDFSGKGEEWAIEQFLITQNNDEIKNKYCGANSIPLLRIPYWDFNNIEEILERELINNLVV